MTLRDRENIILGYPKSGRTVGGLNVSEPGAYSSHPTPVALRDRENHDIHP